MRTLLWGTVHEELSTRNCQCVVYEDIINGAVAVHAVTCEHYKWGYEQDTTNGAVPKCRDV
jgi:hypothetical protein